MWSVCRACSYTSPRLGAATLFTKSYSLSSQGTVEHIEPLKHPSLTLLSVTEDHSVAYLPPYYARIPVITMASGKAFKPALVIIDFQEDFCPPVSGIA